MSRWVSGLLTCVVGAALPVLPHGVPAAEAVETPSHYAAEVLGDAPVAYWRFDEGQGGVAGDDVGGFDGSLTGGASFVDDTGVAGSSSAVSFDGANDYVYLGRRPELSLQEFPFETWPHRQARNHGRRLVDVHPSTRTATGPGSPRRPELRTTPSTRSTS
jgi:hypothetical protein